MYLDKPLRDHTLLQAICRTNRPYGEQKTHGLIVDYLGVFDDVAKALEFDEKGVARSCRTSRSSDGQATGCRAEVPRLLPRRATGPSPGYEGLIAAQECLPNNETRDAFAAEYSVLARLWEALSPDPCSTPHETDYRWLSQVYESVKPRAGPASCSGTRSARRPSS